MQNSFKTQPIQWLVGDSTIVETVQDVLPLRPFESKVLDFLNRVSKILLKDKNAKAYPEIVTFAFWIRKASLMEQKRGYGEQICSRLGRGVIFHIAPSNVPVNFAYSLVSGLLAGNANIIKVPSKIFEQVDIILNAINLAFEADNSLIPYIVCVRYGHEESINDAFSAIASTRIIWGGDATIGTIRRSPLPPRSNEITFSDRYSVAVLDSSFYLKSGNKERVASDFYNDTYLSDQNACTSPMLIFWLGEEKDEAKRIFWGHLYTRVAQEYSLQAVQSVSKYTKLLEWSAGNENLTLQPSKDNLITRVDIKEPSLSTIKNHGNSGLFLEYDANELDELYEFCNDTHCQTLGYYGELSNDLSDFVYRARPKGIDRIVPIGKTMDFSLVWDGVDLILGLSRVVSVF